MLLAACSGYPSTKRWVATTTVQAFDAVEGAPSFKIPLGEECQPIRDMAGKVDMYTLVKCRSGSGWVRSDSPFDKAGK
ncbi:hypothetical protein EV147_1057 [Cupriavidus agavae]|uniref:Uncharacterized protein n=1 Tax=Cupriavidus agavae TaxID=1001822 RepID=A0A4Q7S6N3_9BURK|nr:hypothetical protein EV147_1057 [Cupriavidus agavae]